MATPLSNLPLSTLRERLEAAEDLTWSRRPKIAALARMERDAIKAEIASRPEVARVSDEDWRR